MILSFTSKTTHWSWNKLVFPQQEFTAVNARIIPMIFLWLEKGKKKLPKYAAYLLPIRKQESPFKEREHILIACLSGKEHYGFGRCLTPKRPLNDFSRQFLYVSESFLEKMFLTINIISTHGLYVIPMEKAFCVFQLQNVEGSLYRQFQQMVHGMQLIFLCFDIFVWKGIFLAIYLRRLPAGGTPVFRGSIHGLMRCAPLAYCAATPEEGENIFTFFMETLLSIRYIRSSTLPH